MTDLVHQIVEFISAMLSSPEVRVYPFEVRALLAILCVSLSSGLVGSLVIGHRMAFFSDAMAHTAFAGVALALLGIVVVSGASTYTAAEPYMWVLPWVMCGIGALVGVLIALIREETTLEYDTVIGVFFALSLGLAAVLLPALKKRVNIDAESIIFGQLFYIQDRDLLALFILAIACIVVVFWRYNSLVFGSMNVTLARSRGLPVRMNNYLFIILLAMVVNLSIKAVGILLINALLVVPAAAAANVSSNIRRMFWITLIGSVLCGIIGYRLSTQVSVRVGSGEPLQFGPGGVVVITCVSWFFASIVLRMIRSRFFGSVRPCPTCSDGHSHGQYGHTH